MPNKARHIMLKLMYITNDPKVARILQTAGVDRVFVDMEYIGKDLRQGGMNTVQSHHTVADVRAVRAAVTRGELLVRVNPIHPGSQQEIRNVIEAGADILMLPYFKSAAEVGTFLNLVGGRAKTLLLLETPESVDAIEEILTLPGIDEVLIGLNDLHLGYKRKFMFELLADGTVESLCNRLREAGIPYGFGGVARVGTGTLPAQRIIGEHVRLGSQCVILSRSFCNTAEITDYDEIERIFMEEVPKIRRAEQEFAHCTAEELLENKRQVAIAVQSIVEKLS